MYIFEAIKHQFSARIFWNTLTWLFPICNTELYSRMLKEHIVYQTDRFLTMVLKNLWIWSLCYKLATVQYAVIICYFPVQFTSVQSLDCVRLFGTPWIAACQASLSITNSQNSLRFMSMESVMPSSHLILCRPLLLLPPIPPSIRVFSNESTLHMRWPKDWSFSFSIIPSKEIPGLISFRMDWLDLLAVQGTLKSLLQHCSSKSSVLWCS